MSTEWEQMDCVCCGYIRCSIYSYCHDTMRTRSLKTVNLGWNSILFVCYFYWSLERFRFVGATISKYSVCNISCDTSCAEDRQLILLNKTEIGCHNWSEYDGNIQSKDQH
jgi:hypothetical protein